MNDDKKHIIVGLFVLGGLVLFATLIIWFQGLAIFLRGGYEVRVHLDSSAGIRAGKRVTLDGIEIGEVRNVLSSLPKPGVWIVMKIEPHTRIPADAAFVIQQSIAGDPTLDFRVTKEPKTYLPTDGSAEVEGAVEPFLPKDLVADLRSGMTKLGKVADDLQDLGPMLRNLRELTEKRTLQEVAEGKKPANLSTVLAQFQTSAKSLQDLTENPDTKKLFASAVKAADDLSKTLEEARKTLDAVKTTATSYTETGKKADAMLGKGNEMIEKFSKDADLAQKAIENLNGLVTDIRSGKGSLGQLISSDELHRELVNLVENMTTLTDNANRLIILWRHEGITAKEGK